MKVAQLLEEIEKSEIHSDSKAALRDFAARLQQLTVGTQRVYLSTLFDFAKGLHKTLAEATSSDVKNYLIKNPRLSEGSINLRKNIFAKFYQDREWVAEIKPVVHKKDAMHVEDVLTQQDIMKIISHTAEPSLKVAIALMYEGVLTPNEVCGINISDIHFSKDTCIIDIKQSSYPRRILIEKAAWLLERLVQDKTGFLIDKLDVIETDNLVVDQKTLARAVLQLGKTLQSEIQKPITTLALRKSRIFYLVCVCKMNVKQLNAFVGPTKILRTFGRFTILSPEQKVQFSEDEFSLSTACNRCKHMNYLGWVICENCDFQLSTVIKSGHSSSAYNITLRKIVARGEFKEFFKAQRELFKKHMWKSEYEKLDRLFAHETTREILEAIITDDVLMQNLAAVKNRINTLFESFS